MGKKNRQSVDGAARKDAAAPPAAAAKQPPAAAAPPAQAGPEVAPQHEVARIVGRDATGTPRDELLVTVRLPTVQSASRASDARGAARTLTPLHAGANDVRDLVIRAERISLRVAGKVRGVLRCATTNALALTASVSAVPPGASAGHAGAGGAAVGQAVQGASRRACCVGRCAHVRRALRRLVS